MAYLDYPGLSYFKSLLDETYLRTSYTGDTTIAGDVTFTGDTVFSEDITGNVDGKAKKDWRGQQIDSTYIKEISTNDNVGQIVYTKGDGTSNYIMIDMMQGATASVAGKAGLVPAPTISERTKFLRGDGEWGVPTDIYVTQNLINTNDSFPILIGATAGATESQIGTAIAFGTKVSVNPNTHALIADHLILKHPTYRRDNAVTSKVMYTLNFADSNDGNGNNLSEIYGYIDKPSEGGEHELGFRLFGNPNVQGVEEIFTYLSVGLSKTNIPYGHAPETPVPADHDEDTDIITRSYLKLNGSITGLVHTTMPETISGIKTFTDETRNTSTAGITTTKLTASGKITGTGTAEISGGSSNTPSLKVTGNETVTGDLNVGGNETVAGNETVTGNISTTAGNITTTNGTVSGKTGNIGSGGLTVTGPSNLNGKVIAGNGLDVTGNETVSGNLTVGGATTTQDLHVTDDATIDDQLTTKELHVTHDTVVDHDIIVKNEVLKYNTTNNTTEEYVSYITNQEGSRTTIINNIAEYLVDPDQGLKFITKGTGANAKKYIAFKLGNGLAFHAANDNAGNKGQVDVDFNGIPASVRADIVNSMVDPEGAIIPNTEVPQSNTARYGKLTVDFSKLSNSQIEKIVLAMIAHDDDGNLTGGLATDEDTGKLIVDFNQMPQDRFNKLKDSLDMQRTLSTSKTVYVDYDNADNDTYRDRTTRIIDDTKGTEANPFKTIQGAVNFITSIYALGDNNVTIYVKPRTNSNKDPNTFPNYQENLRLPSFTTTSGVISIKATDPVNGVPIHNASPCTTTIYCTGGTWHLYDFDIINDVRDPASNVRQYPNALSNTGSDASVTIHGCHFKIDFKGTKAPYCKNGHELVISGLKSKPQKVMVGGVVLWQQDETYVNGQYYGWPYQPERPTINDANGITTFLAPSWTAPTKTNNVVNEDGKLTFRYTFKAQTNVTEAVYPIVIDKDDNNKNIAYGNLTIDTSNLTASPSITMRCCHTSLAATSFTVDTNRQTSFECYHRNVSDVYTRAISGERQAYIQFSNSNTTDSPSPVRNATGHVNMEDSILAIPSKGQFSRFCALSTGAQCTMFGGGFYFFFFFPYEVSSYYDTNSNTTKQAYKCVATGQRYELGSNAGCTAPRSIELQDEYKFTAPLTSAANSETATFVSFEDFAKLQDATTPTIVPFSDHKGFPGTIAGSPVDTDITTFCWYKEYNTISF